MNKDVMYLVKICSGMYEDYTEQNIFVTRDKDKAKKWVDRYNRIVDENVDRIQTYYDDGDYDKPELYCYWILAYDNPNSIIEKLKVR